MSYDKLLVDACEIRRVSGETFNETTGQTTQTQALVYTGRCRLAPTGARERQVLFGDEAVAKQAYACALPNDALGVQRGDVVTVTKTENPYLTGREMPVHEVLRPSRLSGVRVILVETED